MISRIEGVLEAIQGGKALLRCGPIAYELLLPGVDQQRLTPSIGATVSFHTLHYLESHGQGASFTPRLIGFQSPADRAFFELFTTVKGLGNRKALRALQMPFHQIAAAIARKDVDFLKSLPEIGKRTAETIVAEIHGKVDPYVQANDRSSSGGRSMAEPKQTLADEAIAVLTSLGEQRLNALQLIERVLEVDPTIDSAEALVAAAYRLKG